jgi:hypothetical protein
MRFGQWRGVTLAFALMTTLSFGFAQPARAGWIFHRAIPRETPALDYRTGQQMMAPPIPYGEYAKDHLGGILGAPHGLCAKLGSHLHGKSGSNCDGPGCNQNGNDPTCLACSGSGCSMCGGHGRILGMFGSGSSCASCGIRGNGVGSSACGVGQPCSQAPGVAMAGLGASSQEAASPQGVADIGSTCGQCRGRGCGLCRGHRGGLGHGWFGHNGSQNGACGSCGGSGCAACSGSGSGGDTCRRCGGAGCSFCGHGHSLHGLLSKFCHGNQIKYFVGAGGPVPITPGYVPYVVPTRSPRDFFSFPPFSDSQP